MRLFSGYYAFQSSRRLAAEFTAQNSYYIPRTRAPTHKFERLRDNIFSKCHPLGWEFGAPRTENPELTEPVLTNRELNVGELQYAQENRRPKWCSQWKDDGGKFGFKKNASY